MNPLEDAPLISPQQLEIESLRAKVVALEAHIAKLVEALDVLQEENSGLTNNLLVLTKQLHP